MRLSLTLQRLFFATIFIYFVSYGATWDGVLDANRHYPTLLLFSFLVVFWLFTHWRKKWLWHTTAFDLIFVGWCVAIALSIVTHSETWRRSAEAVWYVGLYIALWYMLTDAISNGLKRSVLIDALLITAFVQMIFAGLQVINFYNTGGTNFPRPVGTIGNPNTFGAFLVVIIPLVWVNILQARQRVPRVVMSIYGLIALFLLFATFSRGAWVGVGVGLLVVGGLWLAYHNMLSRQALMSWWQTQQKIVRGVVVGTIFAVGLAGLGVAIFTLQSFSIAGRGSDLRTLLWEFALRLFSENPLTGTGLFTYGYHLPKLWSIPPLQPHSHPHNAILLILAELGVIGAIVLGVSVFFGWRMVRTNWQAESKREKPLLIGGVGALVGFGVHHLFDTPAMLPVIALLGLLVLTLVITPLHPRVMQARWRIVGHPIGMAVIWVSLIGVGLWQTGFQQIYLGILKQTSESDNYAQGAQDLATLLASDPQQSAYLLQRAYFLGIAASENASLAEQAKDAYMAYLKQEPNHGSAWANLAALYWQLDDQANAQSAIKQALVLAPQAQPFQQQYAIYVEGAIFDDTDWIESPYTPNTAYYQFLRYIFTSELIPQVGWGQ